MKPLSMFTSSSPLGTGTGVAGCQCYMPGSAWLSLQRLQEAQTSSSLCEGDTLLLLLLLQTLLGEGI